MSVYVDELMNWGWTYGPSCHMYADTLDELHQVAQRIGLRRDWFQDHTVMPHYDLTVGKRAAAIRAGALEHTRQEMVAFMREKRRRRIT